MTSRYMGVARPDLTGGGCWVKVRRYSGSLFAQSTSCGNRPRQGKLTCHSHKRHEAWAQGVKRRLEGKNR